MPSFLEHRTPVGPAIFLTMALSVSAAAILGSMYAPCFRVEVDGADLGLVADRESVETAVDRVEARASRILGYDYTLSQTITYTPQLALKEDVGSASGIETYLFDQIGEVMQTSVLTVNGQVLGATDDAEGLNAMLDALKAPYEDENTISAEFLGMVDITRAYTPTSDLRELSDMEAVLTSNSMEQVDYVVQPGETFSGIAYNLGIPMSELAELNPGIDLDLIQIGQVLTVSKAVPFLSVRTVDNVTYEDILPFEVQEVPDDSMYQGRSAVITEGVNGWARYNADVIYVNGEEQTRVFLSTDVITEPVTKVVAVGTKERPKTMATDSFQWPLSGPINDYYGRRYIFGSYSNHYGLDIGGSYGATIVAADGGKVIWSGYRDNGFGNYVVIDHENGFQTLYGHCSSLYVKTGERVYKGQPIAGVGSTGLSTGNHLHFQVSKNGSTVDPLNYLP